jgi:hypothetical protein
MNSSKIAAIAAVPFCALAMSTQIFAAQIDSNLYATYTMGGNSSVSFIVCGSLPGSEGCYEGGTLDPPFEHACAVLEDSPHYNEDVVTRKVYVLDRRSSAKTAVELYVYERKDTISSTFDTVSVKLKKTILLPINGGSGAKCAMAGNGAAVYAGTTKDTVAVSINKDTFEVNTVGGFSPPANLTGITADERGYVSIQFTEGFYLIGPDGGGVEDGGGAAAVVDNRNAWVPK